MKKTNKEILEFFGLKVGDKLKIKDEPNREYEVVFETGNGFSLIRRELNLLGTVVIYTAWDNLLDKEYEIEPRPKKIGEIVCKGADCEKCPLRALDCILTSLDANITLYKMLDEVFTNKGMKKESKLYKVLKEMLDCDYKGSKR